MSEDQMLVLSLGAGVQSSALALMASAGEFPAPEVAIFADTQDEPAEVYEWLEWLAPRLSFPIHRVSAGKLSEAALQVRTSASGSKYLKPMLPVYIDRKGERGMAQRHCTYDYKVIPILREIRRLRGSRAVHQYLGISFDELERMKVAQQPWLKNLYPLVERRITRGHCYEWMASKGFPEPPRSACEYCPFHSDDEWRRMKPEAVQRAAEFERQYQAVYAQTPLDGTPYLHVSRKPLAEVDFSASPQVDAFINDCEGMCGV